MSIRVTCPGCHTRFNVSEKFAGKEGPCPKCKVKILIPAADEQVVIHSPEELGPKDSQGRSLSKPIARAETKLSAVQLVLIFGSILLFLAVALMLRFVDVGDTVSNMLLYLGAIAIAIPVSYAGYSFLRDQERGAFSGSELWLRIAVCGLINAALWLLVWVFAYAFPGNQMGALFALGLMIAIGGAVGMLSLDLDYIMGILHYGLYLGVCLLGRFLVGLDVLPSMGTPTNQPPGTSTTALLEFLSAASGLAALWF